MYNKLNITENRLQIISLFMNEFNREHYVREVEKLIKISPRTAQLIKAQYCLFVCTNIKYSNAACC